MNKRTLGIALVVAIATSLFLVAGLYAGTKVEDEFMMNSAYEHTKSLTKFTHKKHVTDYKIGCGECHHNDKGEPLNDLKEGDDVKKCIACHKKPGKYKKPKGSKEKLSKKQKREYQANAVHDNCIGCHKKYNNDLIKKKAESNPAPAKCTDCHPKKEKK